MGEPLKKGAAVQVLRGKGIAGRHGVVVAPHEQLPGFWWVSLYNRRGELELAIGLAEGQLKRKEPPG